MTLPQAAVLCLLLAGPALAQDAAEDIATRMEACMAGVDLDALAARAEAFSDAQDYQARLDALCAAGDPEGAAAYAAGAEESFYAADPDAATLHACLTDIVGEDSADAEDVCAP